MYGQLHTFTPKYQLRVHGLAGFFIHALFEMERSAKEFVEAQETHKEDWSIYNIETDISEWFHNGQWQSY